MKYLTMILCLLFTINAKCQTMTIQDLAFLDQQGYNALNMSWTNTYTPVPYASLIASNGLCNLPIDLTNDCNGGTVLGVIYIFPPSAVGNAIQAVIKLIDCHLRLFTRSPYTATQFYIDYPIFAAPNSSCGVCTVGTWTNGCNSSIIVSNAGLFNFNGTYTNSFIFTNNTYIYRLVGNTQLEVLYNTNINNNWWVVVTNFSALNSDYLQYYNLTNAPIIPLNNTPYNTSGILGIAPFPQVYFYGF